MSSESGEKALVTGTPWRLPVWLAMISPVWIIIHCVRRYFPIDVWMLFMLFILLFYLHSIYYQQWKKCILCDKICSGLTVAVALEDSFQVFLNCFRLISDLSGQLFPAMGWEPACASVGSKSVCMAPQKDQEARADLFISSYYVVTWPTLRRHDVDKCMLLFFFKSNWYRYHIYWYW